MPGMGGRNRYVPTKPVPWLASAVLALTFSNLFVGVLLSFTIDWWAKKHLTAGHWHEFRMKGGVTYYLSPAMGWYMDNCFWIYLAGFAMYYFIAFLAGVRWKRVD